MEELELPLPLSSESELRLFDPDCPDADEASPCEREELSSLCDWDSLDVVIDSVASEED